MRHNSLYASLHVCKYIYFWNKKGLKLMFVKEIKTLDVKEKFQYFKKKLGKKCLKYLCIFCCLRTFYFFWEKKNFFSGGGVGPPQRRKFFYVLPSACDRSDYLTGWLIAECSLKVHNLHGSYSKIFLDSGLIREKMGFSIAFTWFYYTLLIAHIKGYVLKSKD